MFTVNETTVMRVAIQGQGFTLTTRLSEYVGKRLAYCLAHGDAAIARVAVRLSDSNGSRGGPDKRCCIEVHLKNAPALVIEDIEADLYLAIDRAAERVGRALARQLARNRDFARGPSETPRHGAQAAPADAREAASQ